MTMQVSNGKAFEWCVALAIKELANSKIIESDYSRLAKQAYEIPSDLEKKNSFLKTAKVAIHHILNKENISSNTSAMIYFNTDKAGEYGDVRDVILKLETGKEIGFSCKNNHEALKHSRLSDKIDFIKKWGIDTNGCTKDYWNNIIPLFQELRKIKKLSGGKALWEDVLDKSDRFYWPILDLWANELLHIKVQSENSEKNLCASLIKYLVGEQDFYKIMRQGAKNVNIQAWNFNGTLATKKTKYPSVINAINNKNGGQYSKTIVFNHGYSLNFRIHSASSRVEPSLKFDINAIGLPPSEIYQVTLDVNE